MDLKKEILKMLKEIENTKNLESIHIVTRTALKKEIKKKMGLYQNSLSLKI